MSDPFKTNRRCFLKAISTAGAGLMLGLHLPTKDGARAWAEAGAFAPNAYLQIGADGVVTVTVTRSEIGQGVRTSLPMIVAEELEADWTHIAVVQARPGPAFRSLGTGGSWSIGGNWTPLRTAGAAAREMLISAAADAWGVDRASCRAESGTVIHVPTNRRLAYGALAEAAAKLPVPTAPPLKDPKTYRIIGTRVPRLDAEAIVTGKAAYGIDTRVSGMRFASVVRCPVLGGKPAKWDATKAMAVPGVRAVVPVSAGFSSGLAIVASSTWAAIKARDALDVVWAEGKNAGFDSDAFRKALADSTRKPAITTRKDGAWPTAPTQGVRWIEALYEYPFQAHVPLEPMNCTADVREDRCEIWAPTQAPDRLRIRVADLLGFKPEAVTVNVTLVGGGFGRRLNVDYALEAAEISRAIKEPVQVLWSRHDDTRHGHFQPASAHAMRGAVDAEGRAAAWRHTKAGSYLSTLGAPTEKELKDPEYFQDASWGAFDVPYSIPAIETAYVLVDSPVPTGPWRAVYSPSCTFARESFLDELAHAAGKDPLQFRLALLAEGRKVKAGNLTIDQTRLRNALNVVAQQSGWGEKLPKGWGRGLACNVYDGDTSIAYVAEVSTASDGAIRVERVVAAVDCGIVVNPSGVEAQVEGGIAFGLSTVLGGDITFRKGQVEQGTYKDYPVIRMNQMPKLEIHLIASTASPTGMGEPPVPPIAPAVTNAIFAATGKRIRRLPIWKTS